MATLSSKVTPSGVATAAQGTLADSSVQPNDSPTFAATTLTGRLTLPTNAYHYSSDGKGRLYYYDNSHTMFRTANDFLFRNDANTTVAIISDTGAVTATSFIGDGSALTGVGGSTTTGAVGTYAMLVRATGSSTIVEGSTYAGSGLRFSGFRVGLNAFYSAYSPGGVGGTPSGTWRAMGRTNNNSSINPVNIFVRIS